ncbi:MAG: TRAP transporter substrate-binding protein DctP [Deltaproteobacteria bacterium]|nr:TRAP transporter substrate-binding protein DctP [Deltaproteobacteria bacterium]
MKKRFVLMALFIVLIAGLCLVFRVDQGLAASEGKLITLNMALFHGPATDSTIVWKNYEKKFEEVTKGRVRLKVFPSGSLVKGTAQLDGVQRSITDLAFSWPSYHGQTYPISDMCITPGIFRDIKGAREAYENGIKDILEEEYAAAGLDNVQVIAMLQFGGRYICSNKKVRVPNDLNGLKFKSTGAAEVELLRLCGVGTTGMNLGEVYEALQRNVIDGAPATLGNMHNEKWGEVAKYFVDEPLFGQSAMALIGSRKSLSKIPEDLKGTVIELLKGALYRIELVRLENDDYVRNTWLPMKGVQIYKPTFEEKALWKEKTTQVFQKWLARSGDRGKRALAIAQKYNAEN